MFCCPTMFCHPFPLHHLQGVAGPSPLLFRLGLQKETCLTALYLPYFFLRFPVCKMTHWAANYSRLSAGLCGTELKPRKPSWISYDWIELWGIHRMTQRPFLHQAHCYVTPLHPHFWVWTMFTWAPCTPPHPTLRFFLSIRSGSSHDLQTQKEGLFCS